ncbi:DUF1499 domain-containing protein [Methylobacterium isbiliense]|jgi:uncharacterized protein (DUF1499 family)|uniref:DUF1499 domain-containing protein n=1 Tax=Methylobacterium isbiliense TaxID=315478 RepID=A0ABQ4SEA5_9HYPH|nr:DUF1499 domain-containing protein [Methylobacterium isbiliense]MDN3621608.1 DUF1499 domain-containing protein [Methylobacterium isbiliense]GJE00748.1 hypothetical protein GMJLKIPL_2674 [Methylobacterium isbiliense]
MRRRAAGAALALGLLTLAGAVVVARGEEPGGIDDLWVRLFGPPDLGPVDFATLRRSPHDALACPPDICPNTPADLVAPVYPVAGAALREIVRAVAQQEPRTEPVFTDRWGEQDRYVARSRLMRCPDTITVEIIGRGEGASTLALHSRSQIGYGDFGENRARLARWLAAIGTRTR